MGKAITKTLDHSTKEGSRITSFEKCFCIVTLTSTFELHKVMNEEAHNIEGRKP